MSVTLLRAELAGATPVDFTPAIRTPDQFMAAHQRIGDLLSSLTTNGLSDASDVVLEVQNLRAAMDSAPFCMLGGEVAPRGFSVRVISRLD